MTKMQVLKKYKTKWSIVEVVLAVESIDRNCSNERVAEKLNITSQHTGRRVIIARDAGFIENAPTHPARRNWQLTELGEQLKKDLESK